MHKASCKFNYNKGTFLKEPINEFINTKIKSEEIKNYEPYSCIKKLLNQTDFSFHLFIKDIPKSIKDIKKKKGNINFSYENYESKYDKLKHCID